MIDFNKMVGCFGKDAVFRKGWEAFTNGKSPRSAPICYSSNYSTPFPKGYIHKWEEPYFIRGWVAAWKRHGNIFPETENYVTGLIHDGWRVR